MFSFLKSQFNKIFKAFDKTRSALGGKIRSLFTRPLNEETLETLEQTLFEADLGSLSLDFVKAVEKGAKKTPNPSPETLLEILKEEALTLLSTPPKINKEKNTTIPHVILVVGVNGSGKTTSIAKLANLYLQEKKSVLVAAGDTFRAAAKEQLMTWCQRLGIDCIQGKDGADPSSVIFDGLEAAKARNIDIFIADTAGRLQSKTELMEELKKINRVIGKSIPNAPHEVLIVLDATTGQNAIDQAKIFHEYTPLTGIILTKLDGSAKGGILLPIYNEMRIPIDYIGVGEKADDLLPFNPKEYVEALFT